MSKYALQIDNVSHWYGKNRVLHKINLNILPGQIVSIVGPSGCGKSTLLRAILGTHPAKSGQVITDARVVREPNRDVGIVYQHYSLFEFLTAEKNVAFGLKLDETSLPYRLFGRWWYAAKQREHLTAAHAFLGKVGRATG